MLLWSLSQSFPHLWKKLWKIDRIYNWLGILARNHADLDEARREKVAISASFAGLCG
jgi:hypothetical protein